MLMKLQCAAALLAVGMCAADVQAAQTWTLTTHGHVSYGYDTSGVFGSADRDLSGLAYSQTTTISVDPAHWQNLVSNVAYHSLSGNGPSFSTTVTVGGHSTTFVTGIDVQGEQLLYKLAAHGGTDKVNSNQSGYISPGLLLESMQYVYSSSVFVPTLDFNQQWSRSTVDPAFHSWSYFRVSGSSSQAADFAGQVEYFTTNVTSVPEPATYAMLFAGLGILGWAHKKQRGCVVRRQG